MTRLDELLADARSLEVRAEQDRQATVAGQIEQARAAIAAAFDGVWDEVAPYCDGGDFWLANDRARVSTWWTVVSPAGLAPFSAAVTFNSYGTLNNDSCYLVAADSPQSGWARVGFKNLPDFLLERQRAWKKAEADRVEKEIGEARAVLVAYWSPRDRPAAEADAALARLNELAPERAGEWGRLHADWMSSAERFKRERQAENDRMAAEAQAAADYEAAFSSFWAEYRRVLEINRGRLDALQAELDMPFNAYELTYGYCASDEDGNQYVGTAAVWSLSDGPDADGYWTIAEGGSLVRRHYYHLVSIEGPVAMRPTDRKVYASVYLDAPPEPGWYTFYFHPGADRGEIACQAAALLDPWPAWPLAPDGLDHYAISRIQARVAGDGQGQYDGVPF